jgi:excisionase family DNA binding protein
MSNTQSETRERLRTSRRAEQRAKRPTAIDPGQAYSVEETCAALDISRPTFYKLLDAGRIRTIPSIDGRRRVSGAEIFRITAGDAQAAA